MTEPRDAYIDGQPPDQSLPAGQAAGWHLLLPVAVRFGDLDALGHVNNAVYLTYCEMARIAYFRAVAGVAALSDMTFILARAEVDFRLPVEFNDRPRVLVRATGVGSKSFTLQYRILVARGDAWPVACDATSVQVCYDYAARHSVAVPPALLRALEAFEGRALRR